LPKDNSTILIINIPKNGNCFNKQQLYYYYTKANSLQLAISIINEFTNITNYGSLYDLSYENSIKEYKLENVLYVNHFSDIIWPILRTIKKLIYAFGLLIPLNLTAYILYEAIFIAFTKKSQKYLHSFCRILYSIAVFFDFFNSLKAYFAIWSFFENLGIFPSQFIYALTFFHYISFNILHHLLYFFIYM